MEESEGMREKEIEMIDRDRWRRFQGREGKACGRRGRQPHCPHCPLHRHRLHCLTLCITTHLQTVVGRYTEGEGTPLWQSGNSLSSMSDGEKGNAGAAKCCCLLEEPQAKFSGPHVSVLEMVGRVHNQTQSVGKV